MEDCMNLHKNKELFSQAVEMTSQHFRIKREFVEKDYRYNNISPQIIVHYQPSAQRS